MKNPKLIISVFVLTMLVVFASCGTTHSCSGITGKAYHVDQKPNFDK